MYQDEAGFGRISKLGSCWSPIGVGPHVHSHYIREFRYCYGAVDAHTGESFFLIAGRCNTEWMNAFLEELSQAYPNFGRCHESTPRCYTRTGEGGDKVHR
ncbi:transposase family protein [Streptococcus pneumoniae]|nr:transposase family protein [Streptococcus pneumoniae]